jgi:hypothetical protein
VTVNHHKLDDGAVRINRCVEGPFRGRWFLHKFRHTLAKAAYRRKIREGKGYFIWIPI